MHPYLICFSQKEKGKIEITYGTCKNKITIALSTLFGSLFDNSLSAHTIHNISAKNWSLICV